jgi:hypothetical protein
MGGGREFRKPPASGPAPGDADAGGSGGPDRRLMGLHMRSRKESAAQYSKDPEVNKLLASGNKDPKAYAKAIAASDQPRNALLGDIKDKYGPEFADQVSEALVATELGKDVGDDKDGGGDAKDGGAADKGSADLASSDNFDDAAGDSQRSPTGMSGKTGDDDLGAAGYADERTGKAGLQVSGKSGAVSGDLGFQEDGGIDTISGSVDVQGDENELQASGSYSDPKNMSGTIAGSHQFNDELSAQGSVGYNKKDGQDELTGSIGGKFENDNLAIGGELDASSTDGATAKGSATAKLANGKLYATVTGSAKLGDAGDGPKYNLGGSLTLTEGERMALIASGAMDDKGGLDLGLELDVLKDKVKNAGEVDDAKKDAIVSLFVEYKKGGEDPSEQGVTGGLKMRF